MINRLYEDDPDTTVVDPELPVRHTIVGLPAPARLPADPAGSKYRRMYPVKMDPPVTVTIHWGDG